MIYLYVTMSPQRHRPPPWLLLALLPSALGQCFGGVETYEKTSGTTVSYSTIFSKQCSVG